MTDHKSPSISAPAAPAAPAAAQPIGTPPAGGRWTWDGSAWVPLPAAEEPAAATAIATNATTPKE